MSCRKITLQATKDNLNAIFAAHFISPLYLVVIAHQTTSHCEAEINFASFISCRKLREKSFQFPNHQAINESQLYLPGTVYTVYYTGSTVMLLFLTRATR